MDWFRFPVRRRGFNGSAEKVMTGHDHGTITLNIAEADDAYARMHAPCDAGAFTGLCWVIFRHEIGHYYWERLVQGTNSLEPYRELFGTSRRDYNEDPQPVLPIPERRRTGPENFISAYATAHPWEDWADHGRIFLHIQDPWRWPNDFGLAKKQIPLTVQNGHSETCPSSTPTAFDEAIAAWVRTWQWRRIEAASAAAWAINASVSVCSPAAR